MPKEVLLTNRDVYGPESGAVQTLEVRFGHNGFVEFGSRVVYAVDHESDYVPTEAERRRAGEGDPFRGLYNSLDRGQINTLIKHLRRARDYAFGKDA